MEANKYVHNVRWSTCNNQSSCLSFASSTDRIRKLENGMIMCDSFNEADIRICNYQLRANLHGPQPPFIYLHLSCTTCDSACLHRVSPLSRLRRSLVAVAGYPYRRTFGCFSESSSLPSLTNAELLYIVGTDGS